MNPGQNEPKIYNRPFTSDDIIYLSTQPPELPSPQFEPPELPLPQFDTSKLNSLYEDRFTPKR